MRGGVYTFLVVWFYIISPTHKVMFSRGLSAEFLHMFAVSFRVNRSVNLWLIAELMREFYALDLLVVERRK